MNDAVIKIHPHHLEQLAWPNVLRELSLRTSTEPGQAAALSLPFAGDYLEALEQLHTVDELAMALDEAASDPPLSGLFFLEDLIDDCRRGVVLEIPELLAFRNFLEALVRSKAWLKDQDPSFFRLSAFAGLLPELSLLAEEMKATFDEHGQVADHASKELAEARRTLIQRHRRIKAELDRFVNDIQYEDALQEKIYTLRDDRYVVLVKSGAKNEIPGIIHGRSNTSESIYVEPQAYLEKNNAIKLAASEVKIALERVLKERSQWLADEGDEILKAYKAMVELDLMLAKARFMRDYEAVIPELSEDGSLALYQARNPILAFRQIALVANDIVFEPPQQFLVITGPNTGGKTVTLSTVGLSVLMFAAGIPILADEESCLPPYSQVFSMLGDHQDLSADKSTFSGQLIELQGILKDCTPNSLVLLDELATGTSPSEGAALALAILEAFLEKGAMGLVTTHYEQLKFLPMKNPRFSNASVGFDEETRAPNFRLEKGRSGKSNPLEIAAGLGFPAGLIRRAEELLGKPEGGALQAQRLQALEEAAEDARLLQESEYLRVKELTRRLEEELKEQKIQNEHQIRKLQEKLLKDIGRAKKEWEALKAKMKEAPSDALLEKAKVLEESVENVLPPLPKKGDPKDAGPLPQSMRQIGQKVYVPSLKKAAEIIEINGDRAVLLAGSFRLTQHMGDLRRLSSSEAASPRPSRPFQRTEFTEGPKALAGDPEEEKSPFQTKENTVDLRGFRRDEVIDALQPAFDHAYYKGLDGLWVIHGVGTGALREEVRAYLAASPHVKSYRSGRQGEGGDGVTLVLFNEES